MPKTKRTCKDCCDKLCPSNGSIYSGRQDWMPKPAPSVPVEKLEELVERLNKRAEQAHWMTTEGVHAVTDELRGLIAKHKGAKNAKY